jgi:hypothetical protein
VPSLRDLHKESQALQVTKIEAAQRDEGFPGSTLILPWIRKKNFLLHLDAVKQEAVWNASFKNFTTARPEAAREEPPPRALSLRWGNNPTNGYTATTGAPLPTTALK